MLLDTDTQIPLFQGSGIALKYVPQFKVPAHEIASAYAYSLDTSRRLEQHPKQKAKPFVYPVEFYIAVRVNYNDTIEQAMSKCSAAESEYLKVFDSKGLPRSSITAYVRDKSLQYYASHSDLNYSRHLLLTAQVALIAEGPVVVMET